MTRTLKAPEVRRGEILDAAEELFGEAGYEDTSVNDILLRAGIAKGTLYYYFKSKEEILDAVLARYIAEQRARMEAAGREGSALERFARALACSEGDERKWKLIETLHLPKNALMHQKSLVASVKELTPLFTDIVERGVREGIFDVVSPHDTVEFMLAGMQFLLDSKIFGWSDKELTERGMAFIKIAERLLGAADGTLNFLSAYMQAEEV